jgi:eukaryotic-like serine/threonine-protein kinase
MHDDTGLRGPGDRFPLTRRSVVIAAGDADPEVRRQAQGALVASYWRPVYKYLRVKWREDREDAEDLTQGFFAAALRHLQEVRILARLEHLGIVPVHDVGTLPDGRVFYAMKRVRGKRLDEVAKTAPLPERLRVFSRICEAVAFAHAHGVIHRDLKPENVMVGSFGEVLVMDWGVRAMAAEPGEPGERYPRVEELSADLSRYLSGFSVDAYRESLAESAARVFSATGCRSSSCSPTSPWGRCWPGW